MLVGGGFDSIRPRLLGVMAQGELLVRWLIDWAGVGGCWVWAWYILASKWYCQLSKAKLPSYADGMGMIPTSAGRGGGVVSDGDTDRSIA